jgi:hypothetical protein
VDVPSVLSHLVAVGWTLAFLLWVLLQRGGPVPAERLPVAEALAMGFLLLLPPACILVLARQ